MSAGDLSALRGRCRGVAPLGARLEPWMVEICSRPNVLARLLDEHGSPVNLIDPRPLGRNAAELTGAAHELGVDLSVYFARKANKALALVDEAIRLGLGIDLASERELSQVLARGADPGALVMTAAIKPRALLELCIRNSSLVVVDNEDELAAIAAVAESIGAAPTPIALRLAPELGPARIETRFGLPVERWHEVLDAASYRDTVRIEGVHFHLDGYAAADRIAALGEAIALVDELRAAGAEPRFVDIGGGIPIDYLERGAEWEGFQAAHREALLAERPALTFENHGLGLTPHGGELAGRLNTYPVAQAPVRGEWLGAVLRSRLPGESESVAGALRARGLELRCEPGRSLLDGCGITVARVEFRKQRRDGTWLIGLAMNRTQCRSSADEFPVDPLLLRPRTEETGPTCPEAIEGYLVGAYCIERELLSWRLMSFPGGVERGDLVVFPNTGGYMMHILESASHQIPLARNLIVADGTIGLDPIDLPAC